MRKITAWLIAAAVLIPSPGRAQTRVGIVTEAGLGAVAAPAPALTAPALSLSPAALSAAALSTALAAPLALTAPVIAAAIQPAAAAPAAPAAPTAKIVPAALSALTPAAAAPDKPGSEQARAAGTALFDGAARLSAPAVGDGPSVPGSASDRRRASGLSPPTDAELTAAYREARPQSQAIETFGRDFVAAAGQAMQKYTFMGDYFLQQMNEAAVDIRGRAIYKAAEDLIGAHDAREDAPSRRFMELLGRWYAFQDHGREKLMAMKIAMMKAAGRGGPAPNLPPSPIPGGEYWDMAAGMNAQGFIHRELEPGTRYSFFDYSPFVVSYLRTAAELAGVTNAAVVEADLNQLTRPARPLAVLRTKNAVHYVPGFDKKLEEMADWIAPGGQLVIQNDPNPGQRSLIVQKHGPLIRRLLAEGWDIEYGFSGRPGKFSNYALDTLILTRPKLVWEKTPEETARAWKAYVDAVARTDAEFNPFGFLFR